MQTTKSIQAGERTQNIIREELGFSLEFRKADGKYFVHEGLDSLGNSWCTDEFSTLSEAVEDFNAHVNFIGNESSSRIERSQMGIA